MRAVVVRELGAPDVLQVEDVPSLTPARSQVLVRLHAAGVNPVETYLRAGSHTRRPTVPWTPGTDGAGVIEAVGSGCTRVRPGDRVYVAGAITGTYAEQCLCGEDQVHSLPDRLSFAQGAALHVPYATAYVALFGKARLRMGEWLLVHGATGGVGIATVQLAHAAGARVIGTGGTEEGRALVAELGAHHVLDHRRPDHLDEVVARTDGRGPDVIVEMAADRNLDSDLGVAALRGRIVVVGSRGTVQVEPRKAMTRDLSVLGLSLFNVPQHELFSVHARLAASLADGTISPVVRRGLTLVQAPRAHELVLEGGALGKIVLEP